MLSSCWIHFFMFLGFLVWFIGRPGIFNLRERAKWDAWKAVEGNIYLFSPVISHKIWATQIWKTVFSNYSPWKYCPLVCYVEVLKVFFVFSVVTWNTLKKIWEDIFLKMIHFQNKFSETVINHVFVLKLESLFLFSTFWKRYPVIWTL